MWGGDQTSHLFGGLMAVFGPCSHGQFVIDLCPQNIQTLNVTNIILEGEMDLNPAK